MIGKYLFRVILVETIEEEKLTVFHWKDKVKACNSNSSFKAEKFEVSTRFVSTSQTS